MKGIFYRLWRISLARALWLALPLQIVMVWVAHSGWVQYRRNLEYRYDEQQCPPFDLDQWRYFTSHELRRSIHRALAPSVTGGDGLETLSLSLDREDLGMLNANLPESGKTSYYTAYLRIDGQTHRVKARYMGDNHWHWLYPQKSWKVRTRTGRPLRDRRSFNLKNPPTTMSLEDVIANQVAGEIGILTPEVRPVKLMLNGAYAGLYLWWDLADESLLRRSRRMPGSIYSGDGAPYGEDGVGVLFQHERHWKKDAARNADQKEDRADIQLLISAINDSDAAQFHRFARLHLNLEQFAKFVALDRLFGGRHHDFMHNHKIYFDPYKGRFEHIAWDFAYWMFWERPAAFDDVVFPLLVRVREHPEFELAIQRALFDLLNRLPPAEIDRRIDAGVAAIGPALKADGFRDWRDYPGSMGLRLQHVHSAFFSMAEFDGRVRFNKNGYRNRYRWLQKCFDDSVLRQHTEPQPDGTLALTLESAGVVGQVWRSLAVRTDASSVSLLRDGNRNGVLDPDDALVASRPAGDGVARFELDERLFPGLKRQPRKDPDANRGTYNLAPSALRYGYFVRPDSGTVASVDLGAVNVVTARELEVQSVATLPPVATGISCHPWDLPGKPEPQTLNLGPGRVRVHQTTIVDGHVTVVIAPGTTLLLREGVSLLFRGKVIADGTADAPIRIEQADPAKPWGVFALHGAGTHGSRLRHCHWSGGSTSTLNLVTRTGMVSVIDTANITMSDCAIGQNFVGDDGLHWGYVTDGVIERCSFENALSDAFDMDICERVRVVGCRFQGSGNDGLDLMTSDVEVSDCQFVAAGDKGISVGEGTRLRLSRSQFDGCVIGIEIKDSSVAEVDGATTISNCRTGVNLYRKNERYTHGGTIVAERLQVYGASESLVADDRSTVRVGELQTEISKD